MDAIALYNLTDQQVKARIKLYDALLSVATPDSYVSFAALCNRRGLFVSEIMKREAQF